jgi:hypothetical protein
MRDSYSRSYIAKCLKNDADQLQKDLDGIIKWNHPQAWFVISAETASIKLNRLQCFKFRREIDAFEFALVNQEGQEVMSSKFTWTRNDRQDRFINLADSQAFIEFFKEVRKQFLKLKWDRIPTNR